MKPLYVCVGFLLGVIFTANVSSLVMRQLEQQWDKDITAFTLTGYYEGWDRGRKHTESKMQWHLSMCYYQLDFYRNDKARAK